MIRLAPLLAVLALSLASAFAQEGSVTLVGQGSESAPISTTAIGWMRAADLGPCGSCSRCGRTVWSSFYSRKNDLESGRHAEGCMECIFEALAAPVSSCAR